MNLRREKAPGLAPALPERICGEDSIASHLLNRSVINAKHARNLMGIHEVFNCGLSPSGSNFCSDHCFSSRDTDACFASGDTA
jgi:hypothetical protein